MENLSLTGHRVWLDLCLVCLQSMGSRGGTDEVYPWECYGVPDQAGVSGGTGAYFLLVNVGSASIRLPRVFWKRLPLLMTTAGEVPNSLTSPVGRAAGGKNTLALPLPPRQLEELVGLAH